MAPRNGENGDLDGNACDVSESDDFEGSLDIDKNAFCGAGETHTKVEYTSTPAEDANRIAEMVATHYPGSCEQIVSLLPFTFLTIRM